MQAPYQTFRERYQGFARLLREVMKMFSQSRWVHVRNALLVAAFSEHKRGVAPRDAQAAEGGPS